MNGIRKLYLDSAEIGRVAADRGANRDAARVKKAYDFINLLRQTGYIPFISHHILHELLAVKNNDLVDKRIDLISTFPVVCWPICVASSGLIGAYPDVQALEVRWTLDNKNGSYDQCRRQVSEELLRYGSGEDLLTHFLDTYLAARDHGLFDVQKTKAIESLTHAAERSIDAMTVADIKTSKFKSQAAIDQWFQNFSLRVQKRIAKFGDPKLQNAGAYASEFVDEVVGKLKNFPVDGVLKIDDFLRNFGVRPDQVNDKTTVWEIGQIAIFNAQLKLLAENGNIGHDEVSRVNLKRVPSWIIWSELNEKMKADYRATGSSMPDRYHATFISYVDKFQCDKRVHHYFKISKNSSDPIIRAKTISFKVRNYSSLSSWL